MELLGVLVIFWYGILHAFGPDHLTAIADFSIGKDKKKTMMITILFAIGHGITLFIFAKLLEHFHITDSLLGYGDIISASVILAMGIYILFLVFTDRIQLKKHIHKGKEHIHIWFGKNHDHNDSSKASAFTIGALMGMGGVRGMLVTIGVLEGQSIDFVMVLAFIAGVMVIFVSFGFVILYINKNLLSNKTNVRRIFTTAGVVSLVVGTNILLG